MSSKKKKFLIKKTKTSSKEPKTTTTSSKEPKTTTTSLKEPKTTKTSLKEPKTTTTTSSKEPKTTKTTTTSSSKISKEPKIQKTTTTSSSKIPKEQKVTTSSKVSEEPKVTKITMSKNKISKRNSHQKKFELSDVHKNLLRLAHNTYGLYSSLNLNDPDEDIKAYVKKRISSDPEKVIVNVYRDIENIKKRRRSSLLREPKKINKYNDNED
jgi:hypothetical protein